MQMFAGLSNTAVTCNRTVEGKALEDSDTVSNLPVTAATGGTAMVSMHQKMFSL